MTVYGGDESDTLVGGYQYQSLDVSLRVDSIGPAIGPTSGGTGVVIDGHGFAAGTTQVTLGGAPCTSVRVLTPGKLECDTTAHAEGLVDVTVTRTDGRSASLADGFRYQALWIDGISPGNALSTGGATVVIAGWCFGGTMTVSLGDADCSEVLVSSPTELVCTAPAHAAGAVAVTVTRDGVSVSNPAVDFVFYDF